MCEYQNVINFKNKKKIFYLKKNKKKLKEEKNIYFLYII